MVLMMVDCVTISVTKSLYLTRRLKIVLYKTIFSDRRFKARSVMLSEAHKLQVTEKKSLREIF